MLGGLVSRGVQSARNACSAGDRSRWRKASSSALRGWAVYSVELVGVRAGLRRAAAWIVLARTSKRSSLPGCRSKKTTSP